MKNKTAFFITVGVILLAVSSANAEQPIGSVIALKNEMRVVHPGEKNLTLVKKGDAVLFQDSYETGPGSRAKFLFADDSLVTLGEKTKLAITENIYDPKRNQRSTVLNLVSGTARALVGKAFTGSGSKFEVHTPTAVAAARGTYFLVWVFEQEGKLATGIWSSEGQVTVANIDGTVLGAVQVGNNQFTMVVADTPPTASAVMTDAGMIQALLSKVDLPDNPKEIIPPVLTDPKEGDLPDAGERTDLPPTAGKPDGAGEDEYKDGGSGETHELPSTPPIDQQPETPKTNVILEFDF
ncbi:MAG: FecR domain-containing protein [Nitrospirae bacterium]|nr:FecR domain-containing protein [Candidatus Troglogloeales bacterium]